MAEKVALDKAWAEAARRCRLSPADVRMAKELGFKPRSLLKNQPSPQQPWKAPVAEWVRDLYAKRQRRSEQRRQATRTRAGVDGGPDKRGPFSGHSDNAGRQLMTRQRRCLICHERPPWHGKNCPPRICQRSVSNHVRSPSMGGD